VLRDLGERNAPTADAAAEVERALGRELTEMPAALAQQYPELFAADAEELIERCRRQLRSAGSARARAR
jgi:hypothetical protein